MDKIMYKIDSEGKFTVYVPPIVIIKQFIRIGKSAVIPVDIKVDLTDIPSKYHDIAYQIALQGYGKDMICLLPDLNAETMAKDKEALRKMNESWLEKLIRKIRKEN